VVRTAHHTASYLSSSPEHGSTTGRTFRDFRIEEASAMSDGTGPAGRDGSGQYAVRVRGHLADRWADWFDGFNLTREPDGTTLLTGSTVDQPALHGLLRQLADLGLALLSVTPLDPPGSASPGGTGATSTTTPDASSTS
jgi:hypothetical protein